MTDQELKQYCEAVTVPDREIMDAARRRQAELAKPPGSLGKLEDYSIRLAGITGQVKNEVSHTRIYVLAADNGVVCEGVSSAPQSVTRAQAINLTRGLTGASCLAKHFGDELVVAQILHADIGVHASLRQDILGALSANAVDIGPADFNALVARKVDTNETCHEIIPFLFNPDAAYDEDSRKLQEPCHDVG